MKDAGSFDADLAVNMQFTVDSAGLVEMAKTVKEISKGKDLQNYWKDVESATDNAASAIKKYSKNINEKGLAENFLKQINALKALTKKENLSEIFPNMDINFDELINSAKKLAPKINSEFSSNKFEQAFKTFDLLKEKGIDLGEAFRELSEYANLVDRNFRLNRENSELKNLIGDDDIEQIKKNLKEIQKLRQEAEDTFSSFLNINKIEKTDSWGDENFSEYFTEIRNGTLSATEAIGRFKVEYGHLLENGYKSSGDSFGLDQLQAFSTKLDSIFRQVEETSNKINDILSNAVIAKSVQNLSKDTTLPDSQRSIFGNILQDEESLKSITALFQKLIDETNQTKNTEVFNTEQFTKIESLFTSIESSLSSIKGVLVDVGDGEELSPLLKNINNVETAIDKLSSSVKGIGLNMNIDFGSNKELEAKAEAKISNALQAYQKLFEHLKLSSAGGSVINTKFFDFDINQFDTPMSKLQAYVKFIKDMREEAKQMFGGQDILKIDTDDKYWNRASAAMGQVKKTFNEMKAASDTNPLENIFGKTDLSGVIEQLNTIVSKLDEISVSAKGFVETFKNGLNVNASVEEIEKLTNRVKELEDELTKIKTPTSLPSEESNILSEKKDAFPDKDVSASVEKIADGFKEVKQETEEATESAKDYVRTISQVGEWNVDSKVSVVKERNDGQLETWNYDAKRGKKDITYDKDGNINYGDAIITTISNYKQLEQTIVKADDKLRDLRKALEDIKEINPNASTKNIEKQIQYQKEYISLLEQTVKMISQGDEYFLNEQQIIDARNKATTEYDLKQGTKSDISNAKQSAKANEQAIRQEQKLTDELRKQEEQARKTALSYTESASKKLSDAISKYSYGDSSDATAMMKQMNRGLSNFGDLSSIESNIKNFDSIVDAIITDLKHSHEESLSALNNEIKAEETMQKQKDAFNKSNLNVIDVEIQKREEEAKAFSNSLKAQMESQQQAESQMSKLESTLSKYQTKKDTYDATIARFNDGGWTSDTYLKNVQAVKDAVKKYEDLLSDIKAKGGITSEEDIQNLKEYEAKIKDTIATVTNMSAAEKGYNFVSAQKELDKIHKLLNENSKMSSEAKNKIRAYYAEIESGNPSMSLDRIHGEIMKIYNAEVEAGRAGRSFFDTLKNSGFHQLAAQMAGMFGVYDVINIGKNAFNTVKELDYALVDLKKTTAMNSSELEQFYYDSNDVAKQMGVTTKEIIDQASSWSRLGYNSKQAATEMAKLSSQFALISPGMDTTTSQEGLVSIMKAWDIGYQDVKSQIMDDINALGNAMAEDNQDIVEGMERSAAALAAVGTSTKDSFALFSGIQEVLQNSEKSGTSLRSVALRLRSFDESTEEYSSDLANITGELADLTKTAEHAQGVSVLKDGSTTEFKSLVDYFREIADIWDEMSQKQQNDFLLKAFGRTQAQAGAALIQNFKGVEKALNVMDNAAGSSDKEMETAKQSITYKLNELKQTWVGTVQDIARRKDLALIVSGLTDISKALGFVIGKLGLVPSLIVPIAAIFGKGKSIQRFCPIW